MPHYDVFPRSKPEFNDWQRSFVSYIISNAAELAIPSYAEPPGVGEHKADAAQADANPKISAPQVLSDGSHLKTQPPFMLEDLVAAQTYYEATYLLASKQVTRTHPAIVAMNIAFDIYQKVIRGFINERIRGNYRVTDVHLAGMGLRPHDQVHTTVDPPHDLVDLSVEAAEGIGRIYMKLRNNITGSQAINRRYSGVVVAIFVGNNPPSDIDLYPSILVTRSPYTHTFKDAERGKTAHIAACYQNEKGQRGQWSQVEVITIP
ncbi:MAG: hypothetical protein LBC81_00475 [Tannerellaceae bacterium]|jgi:hypothetical protein|nr:hypothetical protein [Tannerellaceae bacterium]